MKAEIKFMIDFSICNQNDVLQMNKLVTRKFDDDLKIQIKSVALAKGFRGQLRSRNGDFIGDSRLI